MSRTGLVLPATPASRIRRSWPVAACLLLVALALINLTRFPATWFDEGSHLHVPKTLVTRGVYADYSSEGFRYFGPSIGIGPTVMLPIAAAFKLFGVGLLPARLVIAAYLLITVAAFFQLARSFGGARLAWLAALILVGSQGINLLEYGRQVLGEVPSLAFLVAGWALWLRAESNPSLRRLIAAGCLFGLSVITKNQTALLLFPALVAAWLANLVYYRRQPHRMFLIPLIVTAAFYGAWQIIVMAFLGPGTFAQNMALLGQFTSGAAFVFSPDLIQRSLGLLLGPDVFAGWLAPVLVYGIVLGLRRTPEGQRWGDLMILIAGGLVWYVFASISWLRYAFLPLALTALVAAKLIDDLLTHLAPQPSAWWAEARRGAARALIAPAIVAAFLLMSLAPLAQTAWRIVRPPAPDAQAVADYLNTNVATDVLIETYEPELGFLTDHNYHFPPHALLDTAVRYIWLDGPPPRDQYDLAALSPEVVIVGPFAKYVELYLPEQLADQFHRVASFGPYDVYARVGSNLAP